MKIRDNLQSLVCAAYRYQYRDISDSEETIEKKKPKFFFSRMQFLFIIISVIVSSFLKNGLSEHFLGYIISGLSLFIGLFFSFILMIFNKFNEIDFTKYMNNTDRCAIGVRLKNYFKKITTLSLYIIVLSSICIILMALTLLFRDVRDMWFSTIIQDVFKLCISTNYLSKIYFLFPIIYRSTILYFLMDIVLISIYLVSAFYDFMMSEYNKVKLTK